MIFEKRSVVAAPLEQLWEFMTDPRTVSGCLPGLEEFVEIDRDAYSGKVRLAIGPVALRFAGTIAVLERDREAGRVVLRALARDARVPGEVSALFTAYLASTGEDGTELYIRTEAKVLGKLGEFGQPIMRKTAEKYLTQFIGNIAQALGVEQRAAQH